MEGKEQKPTTLKGIMSKSTERYEEFKFLDKTKLVEEDDKLGKEFLDKSDLLVSFARKISNQEKLIEWQSALGSAKSLPDSSRKLEEQFTKIDGNQHYVIITNMNFISRAAEKLLLAENLEKLKRIAKENNFSDDFKPLYEIIKIELAGEMYYRIGGISLKEAIENPTRPPASIYKLLVESNIIKNQYTHEKVLEENKDFPLASDNRNVAKNSIHEAAGFGIGLSNISPSLFEDFVGHFLPEVQGGEKDILDKAKIMLEVIYKEKQRINKVIFHPNSPSFKDLCDAVLEYLTEKNRYTNLMALQTLGLNTGSSIVRDYRRSKDLAESTPDKENMQFYKFLAESIHGLVQEVPKESQLLTTDDLIPIMDIEKQVDNRNVPTFENLHKINQLIYQKNKKDDFTIEVQPTNEIDWGSFVPPQSIGLIILDNKQQKFKLTLNYQNEDQMFEAPESFDLSLEFDTEGKKLEWKLIESPTDKDMQNINNAVFCMAKSVLDYIYEPKEKPKEITIEAPTVQPPEEPIPEQAAKTPAIRIPEKEKWKIAKHKKQISIVDRELQNEVSPFVSNELKANILVPEKNELTRLMEEGNIDEGNQKLIIGGIIDLNSGVDNKFKALPPMKYQGKLVHGLTVGDNRVLAVEKESKNGNGSNGTSNKIHLFEIIQIGKRKDIYKKKNKKKYL
jgi:hypothetical protein